MTQDIKPLIERLEELDAKRTGGHWWVNHDGCIGISEPDEPGATCFIPLGVLDTSDIPRAEANGEYIQTLANEALPALKAAQAEIDRLQAREAELVEAINVAVEHLETTKILSATPSINDRICLALGALTAMEATQ